MVKASTVKRTYRLRNSAWRRGDFAEWYNMRQAWKKQSESYDKVWRIWLKKVLMAEGKSTQYINRILNS